MGCQYQEKCGGCCFRELNEAQYQEYKINKIKEILNAGLPSQDYIFEKPVFINDGTRRRASFSFEYKKSELIFGFNENKSDKITDCSYCPMLTEKINNNINIIKSFLKQLNQKKNINVKFIFKILMGKQSF